MVFTNQFDQFAKSEALVLWDFLTSVKCLESSDCLFLLGSSNLRVATCGAELYRAHLARNILISGNYGRNTTDKSETEAASFKGALIRENVDPDDIIIMEDVSTNTKDNFVETKKIYQLSKLTYSSGIIVCQPHAMARALYTAKVQWNEIHWSVWAPETSLAMFIDRVGSIGKAVSELLGEVDRIMAYGATGDMLRLPIPHKVIESCCKLERAGFVSNLPGKSKLGRGHDSDILKRITSPSLDPWR